MVEPLSNQRPRTERRIVRDPMQIDILLNLTAMRHFAPFLRGPRSLGEAAHELDVPPSSLAYWVKRLQRVGLLEIVEHRPRAGKAIPVYRATAFEYRIPLAAMPPGAREQFLHSGRRKMFERFVQAVDTHIEHHFAEGVQVKGNPERGVEIGFVEPSDGRATPVTEWWGFVELTDDDAQALHADLEAIVARYGQDRPGKGRRSHVVVLGVSPTTYRRPARD